VVVGVCRHKKKKQILALHRLRREIGKTPLTTGEIGSKRSGQQKRAHKQNIVISAGKIKSESPRQQGGMGGFQAKGKDPKNLVSVSLDKPDRTVRKY